MPVISLGGKPSSNDANSARRRLGIAAILATVVTVNILWKYYVDRASVHIVSYIDVYHKDLLPVLTQKVWWEFLVPMPELNGGVWATTGILAVYALEQLLGTPPRAYYLVTSLAVAAGMLASWGVYRSRLLSGLIGLCFALSTYDYVSYALSGSMIIPLVITFAIFYAYCQFKLFGDEPGRVRWMVLFALSLVLYALSYEGWLDSIVLQWILYPVLAYVFYRSGDRRRMRVAISILLIASIVAAAYVAVKVSASYATLHAPGLEADPIFNYRGVETLIGVEDVIVHVITFFYTAAIIYLPPQLFNFSMSSWYLGSEAILRAQNGYHAAHTQLVASSHLFLWRFYAGIAFALFGVWYFKVVQGLLRGITPDRLSFFVFMTMTLVGSPTHAMVKMRPMHATPLLGYQIHVGIVGITCLLCYCVYFLYQRTKVAWHFYLLLVLFCLNLMYCAIAKPSLLSHMSILSGLGPYPIR